jgi:riboflavin synthase
MRMSDRLGGHIVSGHVDAVGKLSVRQAAGNGTIYRFSAPADVMDFIVEKGSVAVDGISLTVARVFPDGFAVAVIPHTEQNTTLGDKAIGAKVNMETDLFAKYVRKYVGGYLGVGESGDRSGGKRSLGDLLKDLTGEK